MLEPASSPKGLVDFIVICGLDLNNGLEPDSTNEQSHVTPLERCYKSQSLVHFPDAVDGHPIDPNSINMLCLPSGLTFCTQKKMKTLDSNSWFHTFIVTREDGSRSYGHALLYYEEVSDKDVCTALHTLQQMYLAELSENRSTSQGIISRSLPRSFRILSPKLSSKNALHKEPNGALYDPNKDTLYVTKAISLISSVPIVTVSKVILQSWFKMMAASEPPPLPYECYFFNVLYELPMPERGKSIQLCYIYDEVVFQRPGEKELPHFDYSYRELVMLLGIENLVQLFTSVLFENQVLLCASDYYKLMLVAECVTSLLFPFSWQHVYVPVLPNQLYNFLDAPVPYIMGLCTAGHTPESIASIVPGEANLCLVDLDNYRVKVPEELPPFPDKDQLIAELTETLQGTFKIHLMDRCNNVTDVPNTVVPGFEDLALSLPNPNAGESSKKSRRCSKKHSLPFLDIGADREEKLNYRERASFSGMLPAPQALSQHSDVFHKVHAVAKKVVDSPDNLRKSRKKSCCIHEDQLALQLRSPPPNTGNFSLDELSINNAIREIFLNRFLSLFCSYEQFVVPPNYQNQNKQRGAGDVSPNFADIENWLSNNRETPLQNFDKTSFLSDQPHHHLAFLSKFIETQMFTSFIDAKIMVTLHASQNRRDSQVDAADKPGFRHVAIFDTRVADFKKTNAQDLSRYIRCEGFKLSEKPIELRLSCPDVLVGAPKRSSDNMVYASHKQGTLQHWALNKGYLNGTGPTEYKRRRSSADRADERYESHLTAQQARRRSSKQRIAQENSSAALIAQSNWKFVEQLLAECKLKTKRMCVEKMGYAEALELGHRRNSDKTSSIEENTLIAGLCDLLERIWSHGLQMKQGKSALWSHLQNYVEIEDDKQSGKNSMDVNYLSPDTPGTNLTDDSSKRFATLDPNATCLFGSGNPASHSARDGRERVRRSNRTPTVPPRRHSATPTLGDPLRPLSQSLASDIRFVQAMEEVKTDIGFARAWVRLSLEEKCLSRHLKTLLSNQELLRNLYKRHAFLRSDDEKEYFLHYLLTLNAIDYSCFTNTYTNTVMPYRVTIFASKKFHGATTSANIWVTVNGTLAHTEKPLTIPKPSLEMVFKARNLGILTTMRIGHDSAGLTPKILIEHVLIRNEVTGQCYRFPSGRWLGKGIDDGATERLLIAEHIPLGTAEEDIFESCKTPPRCRSPSVPRRPSEPKLNVQDIQQMLGNAVNNIVKHHFRPQHEKANMTILLCGELGLVYCLEQVFLYGFKAVRLFRHLYLWDFFLKVKLFFESFLEENEQVLDAKRRDEHLNVMNGYIRLIAKIEAAAAHTIGKDQRFQAFICVAARDHFLHRMLLHVASAPVTSQLYEEQSFLRDSGLLTFLVQVLEGLAEVDFSNIENSILLNVV